MSQEPDHGPTQTEDTVYAEIENPGAPAPQTEETTSTVYSVLERNPQPLRNRQATPAPENKIMKPETIYDTV
ncbi:hypothetical protein NFI96_015739 [Prochilodus magdalenae]|nr:hypothetical protein NFI96_015739 [Prochilodus magdalenae]